MKLAKSLTLMYALQFIALTPGFTSEEIKATDDYATVKRKGNFTYLVSDQFPTKVERAVRLRARVEFFSVLKIIPMSQENDLIDAARFINILPDTAKAAGINYPTDGYNKMYGNNGKAGFTDVILDEQTRAKNLFVALERRGIINPILAEIAGMQVSDERSRNEY